MAETPPQRNLSLIPYSPAEARQIVLRRGSAVVVYDQHSRQLSLRDASESDAIDLQNCPYCHRPLRNETPEYHEESREQDAVPAPEFVNPEYFRMLRSSAPGSTPSTRPPSPLKRIIQPIGDGDIHLRSPPNEAEFVGSVPAPPDSSSPHNISSQSFSQGYFKTFFVEEKELGRGGKGVVLLVRHVLDGVSLGHFACKRVPVGDDHEWLRKVLVEVQVLQRLSHQNLVSYRHIWLEDWQLSNFGPSVPCAFILQQYCNAGDLHKYILGSIKTNFTAQELKERRRRQSKGQMDVDPPMSPKRLPFEDILSFTKDITSGLNHLHANRYIHRDLKPSNCLLQREGSHGYRVLLSDFGEVQMVNVDRKSTGATGTISYCAPEVLRRDSLTGVFGNFTTKSDVFSLGMIVHFMCFGGLPYENSDSFDEDNEDVDRLRAEIMDWVGFEEGRRNANGLPDLLYKFLKRLLSLDPVQRPSTSDILNQFNQGQTADQKYNFAEAFLSDDTEPRILPVDSPSPGPSRQASHRRTPTRSTFVRPGPSKLRHSTVEPSRSPSPTNETHSTSSRGDEDSSSSVMLRPRNTEKVLKPTSPSSPRLILPPPESFSSRVLDFFETPVVVFGLKTALFLAKTASILSPCKARGPNPWITYLLLSLAAIDFAVAHPRGNVCWLGINSSLLLLTAHITIYIIAVYFGFLCLPAIPVWQDSQLYPDDL